MKFKKIAVKKLCVTTAACSLIAGLAGVPDVIADRRAKPDSPGKHRFPHKPEDPIINFLKDLKNLKSNVTALQGKADALDGKLKTLDAGQGGLNSRINTLEANLNGVSASVNALNAKLDGLGTAAPQANLLWINHSDTRPREAHNLATSNGTPIGTTSGFVIRPTMTGTDRVLEQGLQVPPGFGIRKVAICYQLSHPQSFISHIKLTQLITPDSSAEVLSDDDNKMSTSATCVDSTEATTLVDPRQGAVRLNLGVTFTSITHLIVIRAIGLYLEPIGF
jgi:hypothetical protein